MRHDRDETSPPTAAYQNYNVFPNMESNTEGLRALGLSVIQNQYNLPWRYFVGVLGMTGQTAYYGLKDICNPQKVCGLDYLYIMTH